MTGKGHLDRLSRGARGWFRRHAMIFAGVSAAAVALRWLAGTDWPLFWPVMIWSAALGLHYFLANSLEVDEAWVEERTADLRSRSYDFDHIRDIEQRVDEGDPSLAAHAERPPEGPDKT